MPSKKKYNARFPPARIKKIMQTDEDVGKVAAPVPVLIFSCIELRQKVIDISAVQRTVQRAKALEIFLESLITKSSHQTQARSAKTMTTAHIKQCIQSESTFDFLKDLVENVPDIAQGEEEDTENNHTTGMPASNNRHTEGQTAGISRSSSTASSSSFTEAPQKRRRGRPRKHIPEDQAGPSQRKRSQLVAQSSEERTTSEETASPKWSNLDSDFSDSEITDSRDSLSQSMPAISLSLSKTPQDTRQRQPEVHMSGQATQYQQQQQQPAFGIPIMPQFQVPTAPSNTPAASVGMGLYQMPKASSIGNEDEEDDYDT